MQDLPSFPEPCVDLAGIKVTNKEMLALGGIKPQEVANIVSLAFNEMIFSFG